MKELVFLLEELSARALLESLLPRILDENIVCRFITFEGKQDLEGGLERKIRGYRNDRARFIVLRDLDSHPDCKQLKQRLHDLCDKSGKGKSCVVRIACTELETFYLADLRAVELALEIGGLSSKQQGRRFRNPDLLGSPSRELSD